MRPLIIFIAFISFMVWLEVSDSRTKAAIQSARDTIHPSYILVDEIYLYTYEDYQEYQRVLHPAESMDNS